MQARSKAEEIKTSIDATRSENKVLSKLMQLRANGQLSGIYGRLGNLGTFIPPYHIILPLMRYYCGYGKI